MPDQYRSFLLRMWRANTSDQTTWRLSLENPHTRETIGFDTLEALNAYLQVITQVESKDDSHPCLDEIKPFANENLGGE